MAADIKLDGQQLRCEAWDLVLDAQDRRNPNADGDRRALVHDNTDGLTINWADDYPGGVKLNAVRLITKDPNSLTPVTVSGGMHVNNGNLHIFGHRILLTRDNPEPGSDAAEIYQDHMGLRISGGEDDGSDGKSVSVFNPIAKKVVKWGDWPNETVRRVGKRARASEGSSASSSAVSLLAGSKLTNSRATPFPIRGTITTQFDIVDTFIQLVEEIVELKERIEALEASVNS